MLTNRSAPPATVTPVLIYPDVRAAVEWLEAAFGFEERVRIGDAHRAQLACRQRTVPIVVADVRARSGGAECAASSRMSSRFASPDVDAAFARARDFGARVLEEPRRGSTASARACSRILCGHRWELTPDAARRRARGMGRDYGRAPVRARSDARHRSSSEPSAAYAVCAPLVADRRSLSIANTAPPMPKARTNTTPRAEHASVAVLGDVDERVRVPVDVELRARACRRTTRADTRARAQRDPAARAGAAAGR